MYTYRIFTLDGDELGDGSYLAPIRSGERIHIRRGQAVRVIDVVSLEDTPSPYAGLLKVERTSGAGWFCDCRADFGLRLNPLELHVCPDCGRTKFLGGRRSEGESARSIPACS